MFLYNVKRNKRNVIKVKAQAVYFQCTNIVNDSAGAQSGKYKHRAAVPKEVSALVPEILILAPPLGNLRGIQATGHQEHLLQVILLAILTHIQVHIEATWLGNFLLLLLWLWEIEAPKKILQVQRDELSRCRSGQVDGGQKDDQAEQIALRRIGHFAVVWAALAKL